MLYVLPTPPYCPQGATVPKIFEDGQYLTNPSPPAKGGSDPDTCPLTQSEFGLFSMGELGESYSRKSTTDFSWILQPPWSRPEELAVDCGGCLLLSHCVTGLEGEGVLLAHTLWVCSPLDDPGWNFTSPSKALCRQKGEIALRSVPLLHPNMVSASREQWLKKDFKNRHYLSSGRAIKRNTSQVVSVNTITLQIQGKKSR